MRKIASSRQFAFIVAGCWNSLFALALFTCFDALLYPDVSHSLILFFTYGVSVVQAFYVQKRYVWRSQGTIRSEIHKFLLTSLFAYAENAFIFNVLEGKGLGPVVSEIIATGIAAITTYFLLGRFVFPR